MGLLNRIKLARQIRNIEKVVGKDTADWSARETLYEQERRYPKTGFYDPNSDLRKVVEKRFKKR